MASGYAHLALMQIHPIKALDAARAGQSRVLPAGPLELDRRWALFDAKGDFVNGKRKAAIHQIRAEYDLDALTVKLDGNLFSLTSDADKIAAHISNVIGEPVEIREDAVNTFPDDTDSPGPTLISTATLETIAEWFGWDLEQARQRFRTTLEIGGVEPFWEDRLYGSRLRIGEVELEAVNACQRCIVPSRDPRPESKVPSMEKNFAKRFVELREKYLPGWADPADFSHFYRLAVNTRLAPGCPGGRLEWNDPVAAH